MKSKLQITADTYQRAAERVTALASDQLGAIRKGYAVDASTEQTLFWMAQLRGAAEALRHLEGRRL